MRRLRRKSSVVLQRFLSSGHSSSLKLKQHQSPRSPLFSSQPDLDLVGFPPYDRSQFKSQLTHCQVSVVLPIYNEQDCIETTFYAVFNHALQHPSFDFIFVNDGSTDHTQIILERLLEKYPTMQIRLISYANRQGKGFAVRQGVTVATGDYICYLDSDLAYSLAHLYPLLEKLETADVAIGSRSLVSGRKNELTMVRKITGKTFNLLSRRILNLTFNDMQAGLKGFRREAARNLFEKQNLAGFSFDVELIYLAQKQGYTITEIPAWVSLHHASKASKVSLIKDSCKMLIDLFKIRLNDLMKRYE